MTVVRLVLDVVSRLVRRLVSGLVAAGALADPPAVPSPRPRPAPSAPAPSSWRWRVDLSGRR